MPDTKVYSETEALLLADREVMNTRMNELVNRIDRSEKAQAEGFSKIEQHLSLMTNTMEKQVLAEEQRREILRAEFSKEFATKLDLERLANKVDTMWLKITIIVSTVVAIGLIAQYLVVMTDHTKRIVGG